MHLHLLLQIAGAMVRSLLLVAMSPTVASLATVMPPPPQGFVWAPDAWEAGRGWSRTQIGIVTPVRKIFTPAPSPSSSRIIAPVETPAKVADTVDLPAPKVSAEITAAWAEARQTSAMAVKAYARLIRCTFACVLAWVATLQSVELPKVPSVELPTLPSVELPKAAAVLETLKGVVTPKAAAVLETLKGVVARLGPKNGSHPWPARGGSGAWHPMAGPWPTTPVRELWVPPPGWTPPSKPVPVTSWFDSGLRLQPASQPAAETVDTVVSWYDAGMRLAE